MQIGPLTREQLREIDLRAANEFGVPGLILMENAGREAARWLEQLGIRGTVLFCCGKGNNGGDGYVMARHLQARGYPVQVLLLARPSEIHGDAAANLQILKACQCPLFGTDGPVPDGQIRSLLHSAEWIVDGLLGTGAQGPVREPLASMLRLMNSCPGKRFAIDIPSGLDADTGLPLGIALQASATATFVATKLGFTRRESVEYTGEVRIFDIGLPLPLLRQFMR